MQNSIRNILKKIAYIEADIEIQKQILFSIPSHQEKEIEDVLKKIKSAKVEIQRLRATIAEISPQEHQKLLAIEEAVTTFKKLAAEKQFTKIESMATQPECSITYGNGEKQFCLAKACDADGNWTIITTEGQICHIAGVELADEA
jgi:chromosome segregation ATPase